MSGSFGTNLSEFFDLSSSPQAQKTLSDGKLVSVSAQQTSPDGKTTLRLGTGSNTKTVKVEQSFPEGAIRLGRVEATDEGMRLRLLQRQSELKQVKTEELMKLLRNSPVEVSNRDGPTLKSQLMNQGHISTATGPSSGTGDARPTANLSGTRMTVVNTPDDLTLPKNTSQTINVGVVSSDGGEATLQYNGKSFTVETNQSLKQGTELTVEVHRNQDQTVLEVQSSRGRSFDPKQLNRTLESLGLEQNQSNRSKLATTVLKNIDQSSQKLLEAVKANFNLETVPDRSSSLESLKTLRSDFRAGNRTQAARQLSDLSKQELSQLLKEFGIEPDSSSRKALRTVLETDPNPSKQTAKTVMDNISLVRNQNGQIDQSRLKSLLFLAKNDLPVKQQLVDLLQFAAPDTESSLDTDFNNFKQALQGAKSDLATSGDSGGLKENLSNITLPEFNPGASSERSDELMRVLQNMGFDLESKAAKQPEQAGSSLRAQLTQLQKTLSEAATDKIQEFVETGDSNLRNESRRVLAQLFKFSMGSVAEDDSLFLFVPFPDGEDTNLMKIRIQDESEGETIDDERWNVTINMKLSQLGELQVHAQRHKQTLNLDFRAEQKPTRNLIRKRSGDIKELLTESGFQVSVDTGVLRKDGEGMIDWNLYFDTDQYSGTLDVTI
ncbi:MAG: flagellar hook-length control protein FliK [bacterium]